MPRPRTVRWVGLIGSLLLAVAAFLGGSQLTRGQNLSLSTVLRGEHGVVMPLCWLVGTTLLIGAWWAGRDVVPSTRWALVTVALWLVPLLPLLPMGSEDVYSYACQGYVQHAGMDPYAGGPQQFGCPWIGSVSKVWRDSPAPYGPVFLLVSAAVTGAARGWLVGALAGLRLIAVAGVMLIACSLPVLARRAGVDPARAVWLLLACPLVAVHLVSGAHNDALMLGLLVAGLAVVASCRTTPGERTIAVTWSRWAVLFAGGALLGLAVGVKATAIVVVPFAVLMAVPRRSPVRALLPAGVAIVGGVVAAMGVASLAAGHGVGWVRGLSQSGDTIQWTSPSTAVGMSIDYLVRLSGQQWTAVPITRAVALVLLVAVLVGLWWRARDGNPMLGAGLALAATVVLAPVFHPWYATWPLAVLAATWSPPSRVLARRLLLPCAVAASLTLPDGYSLAWSNKLAGTLAMTALVVVLAVRTLRSLPDGVFARRQRSKVPC